MPWMTKKPCRQYGCKNYQVKDGYCENHWIPRWQRQNAVSDPRYHGAAWQKLRKLFLRQHPICQMCGTAAATVPHHVVAVDDGGEFYDRDNLMALCRACHEREHGRMR